MTDNYSKSYLQKPSQLIFDDSLKKKQSTHIVVRPQLETAGADAEDTGEKLISREELRGVKVLGQVCELFSQISRFL